ncbi:TPA: hypothetical protein PTV74_003398 [Clostridium botulinum]|nr:hypothetical protein [Clostridium botulinum]HDK7206550.1 hypothetical protein [Clostridium botulinum]HDK7210285.1 hypothetical protein [Clostridium botulinum]HDK7265735.1 hypothetical protein [Clostridium botulinum]HDK7269582.1 hypothetical protein [Clostridium botulinum]
MGALTEHSYFISSTKYPKADAEGYYQATDGEIIQMYDDNNSPVTINGIRIISPDEPIYISFDNSKSYALITPNMPLVINKLSIYRIRVKNACRFYFDGLTY